MQFFFCFRYCRTSLFNSVSLVAYNVFYASIHVLTTALDKDLSEKDSGTEPRNFTLLPVWKAFNPSTFPGWFGRSLYDAIFVFLITINAYANEKSEMEVLSMVALSGSIWLQASVCCDIRDESFHFSAVSGNMGNLCCFLVHQKFLYQCYQLLGCALSCTAFVDSRHTG
ncbi:phospholipid-transporting ATPase 2-like [Triticum dicoccoides]|uniref:phospholipid-transporting ATPase 2-like n=1 Tax=Triticum dicoccoides TaxID=85692 RepID=UPI000E7CC5CA|nr:phospholipid-transporting ATPase 2-like [Triticum dicoccoides]